MIKIVKSNQRQIWPRHQYRLFKSLHVNVPRAAPWWTKSFLAVWFGGWRVSIVEADSFAGQGRMLLPGSRAPTEYCANFAHYSNASPLNIGNLLSVHPRERLRMRCLPKITQQTSGKIDLFFIAERKRPGEILPHILHPQHLYRLCHFLNSSSTSTSATLTQKSQRSPPADEVPA